MPTNNSYNKIKKILNRLRIPAIVGAIIFAVISFGIYSSFVQNEEIKVSKTNKSDIPKICPDGCPENSACPAVLQCTPNPPSGEAVASGAYEGPTPGSSTSSSDKSSDVAKETKKSNPTETPDMSTDYVMGSTNYRMQSDSVNSGGILSSSSANYSLEDTVGEIATGDTSSDGITTHAGYQQMNETYISIASSGDVNLGNIGGISGGLRSGSSDITVITDVNSGYTLMAKSSTTPALKRVDGSFANYTENSAGVPDYEWSVASDNAEFGFSPKGTDIAPRFKDNGIDTCSTGSNQTPGKCWYKLIASDLIIASSAAANNPSGTVTTINFQTQSVSHFLNPGLYTAVITFTATTN